MLSVRRAFVSVLAVAMLLIAWGESQCWSDGLSGRLKTQITDQVVPAFFLGDSGATLKLLSPLAGKLSESELAEVDALLADSGVPQLGELLLESRMKQILQDGPSAMPRAQPREAALALPVLRDQIEQLLDDVDNLGVADESLPQYSTLKEYEDRFWQLHVAANKLRNAARLANYGEAMVNAALQENLKQLSDAQLESLDIDFDTLNRHVRRVAKELEETKTEVRINGVTAAAQVLQDSQDFRERLRAAYLVDFDGQQLIEFLKSHEPAEFSRPRLRDENLASSIQALVQLARESAGDLVTKSRLLYRGLHWWLRGRYGLGPDGFGLLKSVEALSSPLAQFPLYMPAGMPTPTDPTETGYSIPRFDRRHHFIWMYEYRVLRRQFSSTSRRSGGNRAVASRTTFDQFY